MINVIVDKVSPRLLYVFEVLFRYILKADYTITDAGQVENNGLKEADGYINYSSQNSLEGLSIYNSGLLFDSQVKPCNPNLVKKDFPKLFYSGETTADIDFDIFSATFYLITEYEKYLDPVYDQHGRYLESEYLIFKEQLYDSPLVNEYAWLLVEKLVEKYPLFQEPTKQFDYEITIDVDHPWAYLNRGAATWLSFIKPLLKLDFREMIVRYQSIKNDLDPFDTFNFIIKTCEPAKTRFFFLVYGFTKFDGKYKFSNPHYQKLISDIRNKGYGIGIHPSYISFLSEAVIKEEISMLEEITKTEVVCSRQHYLKYRLPETFRNLSSCGITNDFSICPVNYTGFRNCIATPYPWFDLEKNQITKLILHPAMAMDVSLKNYLKLEPEPAYNKLVELIHKTQKVGGKFILIWHNSNLGKIGGWQEWKEIFTGIVQYLKKQKEDEY
jgi:hypothetical protein